jgi:type I restriction enzyme M protein
VIAREIVDDLTAALAEFEAVATALEEGADSNLPASLDS